MENQNTSDTKTFEKFTWTIQNFSKLKSKKLYSENFFLSGHQWYLNEFMFTVHASILLFDMIFVCAFLCVYVLDFSFRRILIFPKGNSLDFLSIYLDAGDIANLPYGWSKLAEFKFALINQVNGKMTITKEEIDWGFKTFIPLVELYDSSCGFIVNDTCIIEAEVFVAKSEHENQVDQAVNKNDVSAESTQVCVETIEHTGNPLGKEMCSASFGELMDFRGLGKIEKAFVPLLDEVCSRHPSLIECQQKRSRRFTEWAFTALGRVLHFLKTKKVKDMDDDACEHLQILWEELETFRFDLSWLEPHVQSALGMKSYMERAVQVKMMKQNVAALEMEMKRLKAQMDAAEVDIEIARRDLVDAEEGFEEKDLDAELGYGGP
ncbi:MATH domain and coiled-coil domain-containing protein At3g58270-like isoform X2 [Gastrolobium bilobum]|uniref:MATH domain and coiled-coil domain-containing protein At3g58270-like isoform X2 n=1 Tax=Gastrolobium bilobum TaxID=150636 RepID=UPI002AB12A7E|nr:MATH domain and coiled-coil domain-containing protein At3g58270-like isoform X2 [Gastrolobium bilobum]